MNNKISEELRHKCLTVARKVFTHAYTLGGSAEMPKTFHVDKKYSLVEGVTLEISSYRDSDPNPAYIFTINKGATIFGFQVDYFTSCCGALSLTGFVYRNRATTMYLSYEERRKLELSTPENMTEEFLILLYFLCLIFKKSMLIFILGQDSPDQTHCRTLAESFSEALTEIENPRTNNKLTLWAFTFLADQNDYRPSPTSL